MAEFTFHDLRVARESRFDARWKFAQVFNYSEDVIERIETGKQTPTSKQVDHWEELTQTPGLWHRWMISNDDAYRRRYKNAPVPHNTHSAIRALHYEMKDVFMMNGDVERALLKGKPDVIDDPALKEKYKTEVQEMVSAGAAALAELEKE